jgi:hypothetical protein
MTTLLDKTLKREVRIGGRAYIVAISPLTLKLTPKGKAQRSGAALRSAGQRRCRTGRGSQGVSWQVQSRHGSCGAARTIE